MRKLSSSLEGHDIPSNSTKRFKNAYKHSMSSPKRKYIQDGEAHTQEHDLVKPWQLPSKKRRSVALEPSPELSDNMNSESAERPPFSDFWRSQICRLVGSNPYESDETLLESVERVTTLLGNVPSPKPQQLLMHDVPQKPYYTILHEISCGLAMMVSSLDTAVPFPAEAGHLVGKNRAEDVNSFANMSEPGLTFIIVRRYVCCSDMARPVYDVEEPCPVSEDIYVFSQYLLEGLQQVMDLSSNKALFPPLQLKAALKNPQHWVYRERQAFSSLIQSRQDKVADQLRIFMDYFSLHKGNEFSELDEMLGRGMISGKYVGYLFAPGEIIVEKPPSGLSNCQAHRITTWPEITQDFGNQLRSSKLRKLALSTDESRMQHKVHFELKEIVSWEFDGAFQRKKQNWKFEHLIEDNEPFDILSLRGFPLKFMPTFDLQEELEERGLRFWACRKRLHVAYQGWDCEKRQDFIAARFMIDTVTTKQFAPGSVVSNMKLRDDLGEGVMNQTEPPDNDDFVLLLPPAMVGYSLEEKTLFSVWVAQIKDVVWDTDSFNSLVMEPKTKDLIMALVTHKVTRSRATDYFYGKGNGLVILLHGGPGTGKTLTAESVAEYAQKPLYRVTCGDIGTQPEQVERHLKRVLKMGNVWDCVVLLDEAEVFLQERSLTDLQRNALVSVFLRILEYYDGILILTSNRVGIFDEGFKSRIQLALHYDSLDQDTRKKIWANFFDRLEKFDDVEDIDLVDLRKNLSKLSKYVLNGREIRNAVTTGRQLAMFKGKSLDFESLKDVINISSKFDTYLKDRVNEGMNDDELATEKGLR